MDPLSPVRSTSPFCLNVFVLPHFGHFSNSPASSTERRTGCDTEDPDSSSQPSIREIVLNASGVRSENNARIIVPVARAIPKIIVRVTSNGLMFIGALCHTLSKYRQSPTIANKATAKKKGLTTCFRKVSRRILLPIYTIVSAHRRM